jgi:hypothetical protein
LLTYSLARSNFFMQIQQTIDGMGRAGEVQENCLFV